MNDFLNFFEDPLLCKPKKLYSFNDSRTRGNSKTFRDYAKDGTIIQYVGDSGNTDYALRFKGQYLPFRKDAEELHHENQVIGVYGYPVEDINTAFWEQQIDQSKLVPLWRKNFKAIKEYVDSLEDQIAMLGKKKQKYQDLLPDTEIKKNLTLSGKEA